LNHVKLNLKSSKEMSSAICHKCNTLTCERIAKWKYEITFKKDEYSTSVITYRCWEHRDELLPEIASYLDGRSMVDVVETRCKNDY